MAQNDAEVKFEVTSAVCRFAWADCVNDPDEKRIMIKEQALAEGLASMREIEPCLEATFHGVSAVDEDSLGDVLLGKEELMQCTQDYRKIKEQHEKFNVPVGVAGATGAGKTALLNALLGYPELLPTSNHEAATAVPCVISYNLDDTPGREFRGRVTFRDRADLAKQLDDFFEDLKVKNQLKETAEDPNQHTESNIEALRDAQANLASTLEMMHVLWGLDEKSLETMDAKSILALDPQITKLCGKRKEFHNNDKDEFAESMKAYMDSTASQHTKSGSEFSVWPLVSLVEVFVKADILQGGIQLVDLPGLGDAVESRAAIAEKYFSMLTATLIVAPARRAADDTTSVSLMSKNQELRLQMDGKFHKESFCVVLSQIDQIDVASALRQKGAKGKQSLQDMVRTKQNLDAECKQLRIHLKRVNQESKAAITADRKAFKAWSKLNKTIDPDAGALEAAREIRASAANKRAKTRGERLGTSNKLRKKANERDRLNCIIHFVCVCDRNCILKERLAQDFKKRQAHIATTGLSPNYDGTVSVFPVSSTAFWKCLCDENRLPGFPAVAYTGIPQLCRWIRGSTIKEREAHIDAMLNSLHTVFNSLSTWSNDGWDCTKITASSEWAEKAVFEPIVEKLEKEIEKCFKNLSKAVVRHNPLNNRKASLNTCTEECKNVVVSWSYKNPDRNTAEKTHWSTYHANIRRHGRKNSFAKAKTAASSVGLRMCPTNEEIDKIWANSLAELQISVDRLIPALQPILKEEIPKLNAIKEQIKDRAKKALLGISKNASNVHPEYIDTIHRQWTKTFKEALKVNGSGQLEKRKKILFAFPQKNARKMFDAAFEQLKQALRDNLDKLPVELSKTRELVRKGVTKHVKVLLNNVLVPEVKHEDSLAQKLELQRDLRTALAKWEASWNMTGISYEDPRPEELAIPTEHIAAQEALGHEEEFDSTDEVDSDEEYEDEDEDEEMDG